MSPCTLRAVALAVAAVFAPSVARAALVTDVADAAEEGDPLDVNLELRWRLIHRSSKIVREAPGSNVPFAELEATRRTQVFEPAFAIGLFHDLELHARLPMAFEDFQSWKYATENGQSVEPTSTFRNNTENADGNTLAEARPLSAVPTQAYRVGLMDPTVGLAWGISNDGRDKALPAEMFPYKAKTATWVVGFDYTAPLATPMNPLQAQSSTATNALSLGGGAHRLTAWTAMSKRLGIVDPFLKLHYTYSIAHQVAGENGAWDNCNAKAAGADADDFRMSGSATGKCAKVLDPAASRDYFWTGKTGLVPAHLGGILVGTEIIPVEGGENDLRVAIVVQAGADYVSEGRYYTELSDVLGKLTYADQYFHFEGKLSLDLRFSKWVHATFHFEAGSDTPHNITAERTNGGYTARSNGDVDTIEIGSEQWNPNYDFRLDQPGRRMGVTSVAIVGGGAALAVNF